MTKVLKKKRKAEKIKLEDLEDILKGKPVKKKKKKSVIKKIKIKKKAPEKITDILKAKKSPSSVVKKTGTAASEEISKWLSTEAGFLEGLTDDALGSPTRLYSYQIKYLEDPSFFIHIDKSRQCLPKGSIVFTPDGPVCIEDLRSGDRIYSYNEETGEIEIDRVEKAWKSGKRFCSRIYTRTGNRIESGIEHPFLLEDNTWGRNKDLKHGDELKYIRGKFGKKSPSKAEILFLAFSVTEKKNIEKKEDIFKIFLCTECKIYKKNKIRKVLEKILKKWDLSEKRKEYKFLPEEVFKWDKESQRLLLDRMFYYIYYNGWSECSGKEAFRIGFSVFNRKFAYQIQQLLWNFGIESKIEQIVKDNPDEYRNYWKVEITGRESVLDFYNETGISSKQQVLPKIHKPYPRTKKRIFEYSEKTGKKLCYDISVVKNKNFIFEGFVVHNTGFSYIYAGRSLARSHLQNYHTSIFISINQEEANEKINYARALYDSMPVSVKKKCVIDNKHSLEFEDKSGKKGSRTRIISHAQREPRGKGGNVDVYLDEAAHYTWGEQIYVAAVPIITRGSGTLTIGSSPLGKKGIHYEIIAKEAFRKIYSYHKIYWWHCIDFVKKGKFKEANKHAKTMRTEERVVRYGSDKLIGIFISMDLEQFQQEYELLHVDESVSFFPIDLINTCVYEVVVDDIFLEDDEYSEKLEFPIVEKYPDIDFKLYDDFESLAKAVQKGKVSNKLYAGYDVGRKKHTGELTIIEEVAGDPPVQVIRLLKTFKDKKFKFQKSYLKGCLDQFSKLKLKIDSGGMGEDMAEELSDYSWRTEPVNFTNDWKEEMCSDFRIRLEEQLIGLPNRKDVKTQIHSIKRKVTESGRFIFDAEKNRSHHGDIFWSIVMASSLGPRPQRSKIVVPSNLGSEVVVVAPKIVPISLARSFTKTSKPAPKMPMDVRVLKRPDGILKLHGRSF